MALQHWKVIFPVALAIALTGCDKMSSAFTSETERVSKAFPLPDDVNFAANRFIESSKQSGEQETAKERVEKMMQVRALTCTSTVSIGRFDSPEDIRHKPVDLDCFKQHDAEIREWLGFQRIAALLSRAALVPLAPLGAQRALPSYGESTVSISASTQSNVALALGDRGLVTVIRLPDGKPIQSISEQGFNTNAIELSPNGRVMIAQDRSGRLIKAFDTESGELIWKSEKYVSLISWLPQSKALVLICSAPGREAAILNLETGKQSSYIASIKHPLWAIPVADGEATDRRVVGGDSVIALVDHVKEADGSIVPTQVQFWSITKPLSSGKPFLMSNGTKLLYLSFPGLGWLNMATGKSGSLDMSLLRARDFTQVSDTSLMYSVPKRGDAYNREAWALDVEKMTVARVTSLDDSLGAGMPLSPRIGFMQKRRFAAVGDKVEFGEAIDLQQAISAANLEVQLEKVQQVQQAQARQDAIAQAPAPKPVLTNIPANAHVEVIGVYESKYGVHGVGVKRTTGPIRVHVRPSSTPLVLVVSSYEPVRWFVDNPGQRKISAVLVSGVHESEVLGVGGAQILKIGSTHAFKVDSPGYQELKASIARYLPNPIRSFQGTYTGESFFVGGN